MKTTSTTITTTIKDIINVIRAEQKIFDDLMRNLETRITKKMTSKKIQRGNSNDTNNKMPDFKNLQELPTTPKLINEVKLERINELYQIQMLSRRV